MQYLHLDSNQSAFLDRELSFIRSKSYDIKYAETKARMFIPVDNEVHNGAQDVKYKQWDHVGQAQVVSNYQDDAPRVDVHVKEFSSPIKSFADAYGFSVQDIRAAQMAGVSLDARGATAARRVLEEKIDKLAQTGNASLGLLGFLNQPNAQTVTSGVGAGGWEAATPDEILADMNNVVHAIPVNTNDVEKPDTLILPLSLWTYISTTPRSSTSDTTILEFFLRSTPYISRVESWVALETAGAGGGADRRIVAYRRDPDALQLIIPQEFESFAPEQRNMAFIVNCHMRCGGVVAYYPLTIAYMDITDV